jgi:hypothetical protein
MDIDINICILLTLFVTFLLANDVAERGDRFLGTCMYFFLNMDIHTYTGDTLNPSKNAVSRWQRLKLTARCNTEELVVCIKIEFSFPVLDVCGYDIEYMLQTLTI